MSWISGFQAGSSLGTNIVNSAMDAYWKQKMFKEKLAERDWEQENILGRQAREELRYETSRGDVKEEQFRNQSRWEREMAFREDEAQKTGAHRDKLLKMASGKAAAGKEEDLGDLLATWKAAEEEKWQLGKKTEDVRSWYLPRSWEDAPPSQEQMESAEELADVSRSRLLGRLRGKQSPPLSDNLRTFIPPQLGGPAASKMSGKERAAAVKNAHEIWFRTGRK